MRRKQRRGGLRVAALVCLMTIGARVRPAPPHGSRQFHCVEPDDLHAGAKSRLKFGRLRGVGHGLRSIGILAVVFKTPSATRPGEEWRRRCAGWGCRSEPRNSAQ
jgi:hypothetical protein